jgi:hypothetical protein
MAKHTKENLGVVDTIASKQLDSLALTAEFDEAAYQVAVDLDEAYSQGCITDADLRAKVLSHRHKLLHHLASFYLATARAKKAERCREEH